MRSSPGRRYKWYVFESSIAAPASTRSRCVTPLTAPCVPTGMNAGVSTTPCAVVITPRRAPRSVCVTRKLNSAGIDSYSLQFRSRALQVPRNTTVARFVRNLTFVSFVSFMLMGHATPADAALTEAARLSLIYNAILDARFDEAERQIAQACPPAPIDACNVLGVASLWWRIVLDPNNRSLDDRLEASADQAIASAAAW